MKTILLSIPFGMSARNFLRSDFYPQLREKVKIIVVTPMAEDAGFVQEFSHPNVTFIKINPIHSVATSLWDRILRPIETTRFTQRHPDVTTLQMLAQKLKRDRPLRYWLYRLLTATLGSSESLIRMMRSLYRSALKNKEVQRLFDSTQIDLVFLTHGYVQEEQEITLEAKKRGIKVINMIHSWDNVTSKSAMKQMTNYDVGRLWFNDLVDEAIVWNEILAKELVDLYGFPRAKIFLSGIPQFDVYANPNVRTDRETFFKSFGGDPKKKLIYFLATSPSLVHDQSLVVRTLMEAIHKNQLEQPAQLLIRFHPRTDMGNWRDVFKGPDVYFQQPSAAFSALPLTSGWAKEPQKIHELANSLYHCDILINGMSTSAIDAAAFDKPVICFGFDGDPKNNSIVPLYYRNTHYAKLLELGGIQVAWSPTELIKQVNSYLEDPSRDAAGRRLIREKVCTRLDGQSGMRIAQFLLKQLGF